MTTQPLSLEQTQALSEILESQDWDQLEEFIVQVGYDESEEHDLAYEYTAVHYPHRYVTRGGTK